MYRRYDFGRAKPVWSIASKVGLAAARRGSTFAFGGRNRAGRAAVWLWDAEGPPPGREVALSSRDDLNPWQGDWVSPDGGAVLARRSVEPALSALWRWLRARGVPVSVSDAPSRRARLVATDTERVLLDVADTGGPYLFSSDGRLLAAQVGADVRVWDMPPRTPMTWFPAAAVLLALPVAALAHWRTRRLRRATA
jgi:hypothetical protein